MATVPVCSYGEYSPGPALATYYAQTGAEYQRMADYLVGSASHFNIRSPILLALGELETQGFGNNWMALDGTAMSKFQTYWTNNNATGVATPTTTQVAAIDSVNAAGAGFWYTQQNNCNYTDWHGLLSRSSAYNTVCLGCSCPYTTAYGWSSLFLAYGDQYDTVDTMDYVGAFYVTGPTGDQARYLLCGTKSKTIPVPTFSTTRITRETPYGRNAANLQIVLLTKDAIDYISALQVNINLYNGGNVQPMVTDDALFAANSTQDSDICVIAVGGPAVTAINNACSTLGLSCESFSDFANWEASPNFGYINAAGSTASESYSEGNTAASQATAAGW